MINKKTALVLEGGAMRSLYTSGVLDVFMNNNINFDCVIGALVGSNYVSNQKGRTANININYCRDPKYIGIKAYKNNKGFFGFDYLFGDIAKVENTFDEKTFFESDTRFIVGATNCNVPIDFILNEGFDKIIVVLTRDKDYKKKPVSENTRKIYSKVYKEYPELVKSICNRPEKYNQIYKKIHELEVNDKLFVLQPQTPINVSRLERNQDKLKATYQQGIDETERKLEKLKQYLET